MNMHRYFESLRWQIAAITKALGYDDVHKVGRGDLVALTPEAADITGLPYRTRAQGYAPAADRPRTARSQGGLIMKISDADYQFSITATPDLKDDTADIHYVPAPCQVACPIGTDAPSYIAYIWEDKLEEALESITATNPFSAICGRVCDAPCEPACRRADSDGAIAIRNLKRYVLESLGPGLRAAADRSQRRQDHVAIVGAGPAGLTAAHDLAEAGYEVHVHEATDKLGGMMYWGIPRFRLPESAVQQDIDRMVAHCPGIKIHLNSALGRDVTLDELKQQARRRAARHRRLRRQADGRTRRIRTLRARRRRFPLRSQRRRASPTLPETVLVIGGGDVAMDACRVAKRLPGVKNVKVVYRRDYDAMPARREELHGAIEEGIEIIYNTQPVACRRRRAALRAHRTRRTRRRRPPPSDQRRGFRARHRMRAGHCRGRPERPNAANSTNSA